MNKVGLKIIEIYYDLYKKNRKFLLEMLPKNAICAEIGVFEGKFSKQILKITKPKMLHLIDLWSFDESIHPLNFNEDVKVDEVKMNQFYSKVLKNFGNKNNVKIMRGHSFEILSKFPDEFFDWVYVDGDHMYNGVKKDLELSIKKVKKGGFIAGDDYIDRYGWGVVKAVDECVEKNKLKIIIKKKFQFLLQKPN